jgi:hypothetical protein
MIYTVILLTALLASLTIVMTTLRRVTLMELVGLTIGLLFSINTLLGYALIIPQIPFAPGSFFLGIGILFAAGLWGVIIRQRNRETVKLLPDMVDVITFLAICSLVFWLGLLPSLPSYLPVGIQVDGPAHYSMSYSFVRAFQNSDPIEPQYPSGLHINLALFSLALNQPLAKLIYPFVASVTGLTAGVVYASSSQLTSSKSSAILAAFLIGTAQPVFVQMALQDSWAQLFGFFLLCVCFWLLALYFRDNRPAILIPLAIVELALIASYTTFSVIPFALFLLVSYHARRKVHSNPFHIIAFAGAWIVFFVLFSAPRLYYGISSLTSQGATIHSDALYLDWFGVSLIVLGAIGAVVDVSSNRSNRIATTFLILSVCQTLIFYAGFLSGTLTIYYVFKNFYLLVYPLSILSAVGAHRLTQLARGLSLPHPHHIRRLSLGVLMVILIAGTAQAWVNIDGMRNYPLGMTLDQYQVAVWSTTNLPRGPVTIVGDPPASFWFAEVSGHSMKNGAFGWWNRGAIDFALWNQTAPPRELVVVLDSSLVSSTAGFRILYRSGKASVLQKLGV